MSGGLRYSIAIVHHGDPEATRDCVESCGQLARSPERLLVLWNDRGGRDQSLPSKMNFPCDVIEVDGNLGYSGGANRVIRAAFVRDPIDAVLLLNNDTRVDRQLTVRLSAVLEADDEVGMVGPRILTGPESEPQIWHDGGAIDWPRGTPRSVAEGVRQDLSGPVDFVCGCAPLIRRHAFEAVQGFDERYFLTYEDADLSLRMVRAGWKLGHEPRAIVWHHGSATLGEASPLARYYRLRNRLLFASEHCPQPLETSRELRRLRRRARWRAWRWVLCGRSEEGRAVLAALEDFRTATFGRWRDHRSH